MAPYYDYLPHFLWDLFDAYAADPRSLQCWLREQSLEPFFANEIPARENILDLAGTGSPCKHDPKSIELEFLLENYIAILRRRSELLAERAA